MKPVFPGSTLFKLKDTYGVPVEMTLDEIRKLGYNVDWVGFIEEARNCNWWDFQIYDLLSHALVDAEYSKSDQNEILYRFKKYVVLNPHPKMQQS